MTVRQFSSGASRDGKDGKINPEGALSPLVLKRFCEYMLEKQKLPDGTLRGADNWQLGIPRQAYMESICRHWLELWTAVRFKRSEDVAYIPNYQTVLEEALCALFFNVQGLLHEVLLRRDVKEAVSKVLPFPGKTPVPKQDIHGGQVEGPTKVSEHCLDYDNTARVLAKLSSENPFGGPSLAERLRKEEGQSSNSCCSRCGGAFVVFYPDEKYCKAGHSTPIHYI